MKISKTWKGILHECLMVYIIKVLKDFTKTICMENALIGIHTTLFDTQHQRKFARHGRGFCMNG